jgi:hypothetical protein
VDDALDVGAGQGEDELVLGGHRRDCREPPLDGPRGPRAGWAGRPGRPSGWPAPPGPGTPRTQRQRDPPASIGAGLRRHGRRQHPAVHLPAASNSMVFPESGRCTGTFTALMKASVLLPGRALPPTVPTSLACETITSAGLTRSFIT